MNLKARLDQGLKNISAVFREKNVMPAGGDLRRHPDLAVHARECLTVRLLSAPDMDATESTQMADIGFMDALRSYRTHASIDEVHAIFNREAQAMRDDLSAERAAVVVPVTDMTPVSGRRRAAYSRTG